MNSHTKILVVFDIPTTLSATRLALEAAGYETREIGNGESVLQVVHEYLPDILLFDITTPDFLGWDTCQQIKADPQLRDIFVILLSKPADDTRNSLKTLADDYIAQPITNQELLVRIKAASRIQTAEKAQRRSEQKYQQLIDQTVDGIFLLAPEGEFIFANSRLCEMLGYTEQELLQLNILDTYPPGLADTGQQRLTDLRVGENLRFERLMLRKDGSEFPIEATIAALENGTYQATIRDITERKFIEEALRESEDKFKYIFDHSVIGESIILVSGEINANQVFCEMLGYSHEELQKKRWKEIIHPDDLALSQTEIDALLSGQRESTRFIKRYLHKNGSSVWVEEGVTLRSDAKGEPIYFLTSANNITARRQAELALVASNSYLQAILDSVNDAVFVYGTDTGQIIDVNHSMCEMYGYSRFEALHTSIADLSQGQSPYSQADMLEWLRKTREVGPQMFEWLAKHKNGRLFWAEVSIRFVVIDGGNHFVFVVHDISERKLAEDHLRRRTQEAEILREASAALTSSLELNQVLDNLLSYLARAISCDSVSVFLHDAGHLLAVAARGIPEPERVIGQSFPDDNIFFQEIVKTHQPIIIEDVRKDPRFGKWGGTDYVRGWMSVPLIVHNETIGVLTVDSRTVSAYNETHANLALAFANHAAAAIENARLFEETRRRVAELEVLYENSLAISQLNSPLRIAQIMAENLSQKLKWHHAAVRLYHPESNSIELLALHRPDTDSESLSREIEHLRQTIQTPGKGLSGWVIQHGEAVYSEDVSADPRYIETYPGIRSGVYVPMKLGDITVGCVSVESAEPAAFDKQDLRLLNTIASQTAIAIHQAQLYERVQRYASELEQRVEARTADLRHANLELAHASRMKDEFLASMSHELRTPLTSILGLSEALQLQAYGQLNEKQLKSLKTIQGSGRHLLDLINDILDLSKIEAGKLDLQFEPCAVSDICQASLNLVKGMVQQKKQNITFSLNLITLTVRADARRLKQMLVNLLSNAVKFTPEEGYLGLEVEASKAEKIVRFSVWDKGIGIAPEEMGKLFRPFTQLDSRLARQYSGTGLGLSLVQRMAELHGGSVQVESVPGEGSRFTIILPWTPDVTQPVPELQKSDTGTLKNALVIEDNDVDAENTARYLQALGIKNITQPTLRGALEKAAFLQPSAILLDLNMPDGSGLDLLAKLKADERTRNIPVIIASVEEQRAEALKLGALGYLVKPYSQQDLHTELDKATTFLRPANPVMVIETTETSPLVMIADDNEQILEMISDFLEAQGYRVIATRSGFELLDRAPAHHPDLILVDIQMPGMDGLETMRHLRAHNDQELASTPIIAVTALAMPGDYEKCLQAGANEYMSKPIALSKLLERIKEFLKAKHQ